MTIKELKEIIKDLPHDMKIITNNNYKSYYNDPDYQDIDIAEVIKMFSNYNRDKKRIWEKEIGEKL